MIERDSATANDGLNGFALRRMAKLVRCVHSHTVCVELERLSFLTHPSVDHRPLLRGLSLHNYVETSICTSTYITIPCSYKFPEYTSDFAGTTIFNSLYANNRGQGETNRLPKPY